MFPQPKKIWIILPAVFVLFCITIATAESEWSQATGSEDCWDCGNGCDCESIALYPSVTLFGESEMWPGVTNDASYGVTCGSARAVVTCDTRGENPYEVEISVPLPDYLETSFWEKEPIEQKNVIVSSCNNFITPAIRTFASEQNGNSDILVHSFSVEDCPDPTPTNEGELCCLRICNWKYAAFFPEGIFKVNDKSKSPVWGAGSSCEFKVTLADSDCKTLERARNAIVVICARPHQTVGATGSDCCDDEIGGVPWKGRYGPVTIAGVVEVEFEGKKNSCSSSPPGGGPPPGPPCQGPSCETDDDDCPKIRCGNTEFVLCKTKDKDKSFGNYGSLNYQDDREVNLNGTWIRANKRPGWSTTNPVYNISGSDPWTCDKVSFTVTDDSNWKYYYEKEGSWESDVSQDDLKQLVRESIQGKIPLQYVTTNGGAVTKREYTYDQGGNVVTQQNPGSAYIIYSYDTDEDPNLTRVWAGTTPADHANPPNDPDSGRWIDLDYDPSTRMLTHYQRGCGSCGGSERYYEYVSRKLVYVPEGEPLEYLVSQVKDVSQNVLASYQYDSKDRITSYWLGEHDTGLPVSEWLYSDYDLDDPNNPLKSNTLLRLDYVNDTQYQARLYLADNNDSITAEYHYHDLQSGDNLTGPYSVFKYTYENNSGDIITKATTMLPQGSKVHTYYYTTGGGGVSARQRENAYGDPVTITEAQYTYTGVDNNLIDLSIDARGATTNYDYAGHNVAKRTDPDPDTGASGSGSQITEYQYDAENRLTLEWRKDSTGTNISTKYSYDTYSNLTQTIEDFDAQQYPTGLNLTTSYAYNEYNQVTQVTDPEGRIQRTFYSDSGGVIGQAVYEDADNVISATRYSYNSDGKLEYLSVVDSDDTFSDSDLAGENGDLYLLNDDFLDPNDCNLTWIHTKYLYDAYGRRTAVIADSGGENLTTTYVYDNQSRVRKTIGPDTRFTEIVRDGRGMVKEQITGIGSTPKATTKYTYDFNGNLLKKEDPEGVKVTYKYDQFDRLVGEYRGF